MILCRSVHKKLCTICTQLSRVDACPRSPKNWANFRLHFHTKIIKKFDFSNIYVVKEVPFEIYESNDGLHLVQRRRAHCP